MGDSMGEISQCRRPNGKTYGIHPPYQGRETHRVPGAQPLRRPNGRSRAAFGAPCADGVRANAEGEDRPGDQTRAFFIEVTVGV